jgi:hypothetical protein
MATSEDERRAAVDAAAEARRRQRVRRRAGIISRTGALVVLILTAVVMSLGFSNSWWVQKHPAPSSDQVAADGSSAFTQAGIDYFTRVGTLSVTMTPTRPDSTALGLPRNGTKHLDLLVPVTLLAHGDAVLRIKDVGSLDVITSGGRISAVELPTEGSLASSMAHVRELAPIAGWSETAVSRFDADLKKSRVADNYTGYTATIGPSVRGDMRVSATLSASATSGPTLVVRIAAAGAKP